MIAKQLHAADGQRVFAVILETGEAVMECLQRFAEAERLIAEFRAELRADERTRAFRDLVLKAPANSLAEVPVQALLMNAAVDLMPTFARDMHGLSRPIISPIVRGATYGVARTIRWAFAGETYRPAGRS